MLAALVALSLVVPAADAKEKELSEAAQKDLKKLEGVWKAVKQVNNGTEEEPKMGGEDVVIEFKGRTLLLAGKEFLTVATMDPAADPKCIDFKSLVDMGPVSKGMVFEGIYKLDGDTLVLALHLEGGSNRPAKFESEKDSKVIVVTFERQKK